MNDAQTLNAPNTTNTGVQNLQQRIVNNKVINTPKPPANLVTKREIVILQRGWILVGDVAKVGDELVIFDSKVIRRWGTTEGLGQLAIAGATAETTLDNTGTVTTHQLAVVARIDVQHINDVPVI
jgi:hypothetical protein